MAVFFDSCPICGGRFSGSVTLADDFRREGRPAPRPGDPALCGRCGVLFAYGTEGRIRAFDPVDLAAWIAQPGLMAAILQRQTELQRRYDSFVTRN